MGRELTRSTPPAWALGLCDARTDASAKKDADRGIDGKLIFSDKPKLSAKSKDKQEVMEFTSCE